MWKKIASYLLIFVLIIDILCGISSGILSSTLFNYKFITSVLEKNLYYEKIYNEIMENFKNNTIQSGLEEDVLNNIITKELVEKDVTNTIRYLYNAEEFNISTDFVKNKLEENINSVIKENNKKVSTDEQKEIDEYISTIVRIYKDGIVYSEKVIKEIHNTFIKINAILRKMQITFYILIIVLLTILYLINKNEFLKNLSIAIMASGILLFVPKIIQSILLKTQYILILNQAFSNVVIYIFNNIISKFLLFGIVLFLIGIIINIIYNKKMSKIVKKH